MQIRDAAPGDMARILVLNNAEAEAVNALNERSLAEISEQSFAFLAAGEPVEAFLLALSHETPPRGPNHAWFLAREPKFVYVDRVLVSASVQRRGLARELYGHWKSGLARQELRCSAARLTSCLPTPRVSHSTSVLASRRLEKRPIHVMASACGTWF